VKILGIDYGRKKMGFAIADGPLAEPLKVVRYRDTKVLENEIRKVIEKEKIEKVVVGISEGEMGLETKEFSLSLRSKLNIPVEEVDETLTTHEALVQSIEAGIKRKKRREMEDAYAASIILQNYLDTLKD
jgi:putative holliday junction resolvase